MNKQEINNLKRLDAAVKAASMTLKAQLKALNTDAGYKLKTTNKDGNVTELSLTKREHIEQNLGMAPHTSKKGVVLGYTPATFDAAVDENLKEIGTDGKTKAYKYYVDRTVRVTVEDANSETGLKDYPLYTSEEADKKVKGESAQTIKLYRKATIAKDGWLPGTIIKVLRQSRQIEAEQNRAAKSVEKYAEQKKQGLYIVQNRDGVPVKVKANMMDVND